MNTEHNTSLALKYSLMVSVAVVIVGLAAYLLGMGEDVLRTGLFMVIISPLIGVAVTTLSLYIEKDLRWMAVALILITMSAVGILVKYL